MLSQSFNNLTSKTFVKPIVVGYQYSVIAYIPNQSICMAINLRFILWQNNQLSHKMFFYGFGKIVF